METYRVNDVDNRVDLTYGSCSNCRSEFYPYSNYGCPECGGDPLLVKQIFKNGVGTVISTTIIEAPLIKNQAGKVAVAEVRFDESTVVQVVLKGAYYGDDEVRPGDRVNGRLCADENLIRIGVQVVFEKAE